MSATKNTATKKELDELRFTMNMRIEEIESSINMDDNSCEISDITDRLRKIDRTLERIERKIDEVIPE